MDKQNLSTPSPFCFFGCLIQNQSNISSLNCVMFAQRFDPDAVTTSPNKLLSQFLSRKRKLSTASDSDKEVKSSSHSEDESSSDSSSDSESSSGSSSESSSDSDSDSESESENEEEKGKNPPETDQKLEKSDAMEIDGDRASDEAKEIKQTMEIIQPVISKPEFLENVENDPAYVSKHATIFRKFQQAETSEQQDDEEEEIEDVDMQDLAPIPQPELPRDTRLRGHQAHLKNLDWLSEPTYISPETTEPFLTFGLSEKVLKNLSLLGFEEAFSVQVGTLRVMLEDIRKNKLASDFRGDLLVNASTGSGKTLAYLVPIVEALHTRVVPRLRAIILVPTRPLINQVSQTLRDLSKGTVLTVVSLTSDLSIKEEGRKVQKTVPDIIVSTPGRLVDHLLNGSISMQYLRFLVVDEADRLLNQSFQNWCEVVVSNLEKWNDSMANIGQKWGLQVQKMIFSATLTTDAGKLSLLKFKKPRLLIVNSTEQLVNEMFTLPATLSEHKISFSSSKSAIKPLLLAKFMVHAGKLSSVLVFAKSNDATLRLSKILQALFDKFAPHNKINVAYMNSTNNKSSVRKSILEDFSNNTIQVLVATDLIARGLDILSITDVINYDLPNSSREYVHRVGRTARANNKGDAYTLCFGKGEEKWFKTIMRDVGRNNSIDETNEEKLGLFVDKQDKQDYENVMEQFQ